jgi:hypothetical protein
MIIILPMAKISICFLGLLFIVSSSFAQDEEEQYKKLCDVLDIRYAKLQYDPDTGSTTRYTIPFRTFDSIIGPLFGAPFSVFDMDGGVYREIHTSNPFFNGAPLVMEFYERSKTPLKDSSLYSSSPQITSTLSFYSFGGRVEISYIRFEDTNFSVTCGEVTLDHTTTLQDANKLFPCSYQSLNIYPHLNLANSVTLPLQTNWDEALLPDESDGKTSKKKGAKTASPKAFPCMDTADNWILEFSNNKLRCMYHYFGT